MRAPLIATALGLALSPALVAQTNYYYVPSNTPTSGTANVIPFGSGTSSSWSKQRCQFLAKASFLSGRPGLFRSVAFAPSGSGTITFKAFIITVGHNTSGSLGPTFAASFSGPRGTVINRANFSWVVTGNTWNRIPMGPKPFLYNGKDNLVIDIMALGSNNPSAGGFHRETEPRYYTTGSSTTYSGAMTTYGKGCPGSNKTTPTFAHYSFPMLGVGDFQLGLTGGLANAPAGLTLGSSRTRFGPLPLPLDLGFLGATNCDLNACLTFMVMTSLDANGEGSALFPFPNDQSLLGLDFFSQWLLLDPKANSAGLVTTEGMQVTVGDIGPASASGSGASALKMEIGLF